VEDFCELATGVCGHHFHFHCVATTLKRKGVCPVDESLWEFSRYWYRSDLARGAESLLSDAPSNFARAPAAPGSDGQKHQPCHESHPDLYRAINKYRLMRCAGRYEPVSHGLLCDIHGHLVGVGHAYAAAFGKCIERLPEGGMMISFDDWDWLFNFLDKLAVSPLDVKDMARAGFEKPPAWMRRDGQDLPVIAVPPVSRERPVVTTSTPHSTPYDRVRTETRLLAESDALKELIDWDETTRQMFAQPGRGRNFRGTLHFYGHLYPIRVRLPSDWPFNPPVVTFPGSKPPVKVAFRIDNDGDLHTGPGDWCSALSVEKWLLMISVDVLENGNEEP